MLLVGLGGFVQYFWNLVILISINPPLQIRGIREIAGLLLELQQLARKLLLPAKHKFARDEHR
jgi:hypothetical protein